MSRLLIIIGLLCAMAAHGQKTDRDRALIYFKKAQSTYEMGNTRLAKSWINKCIAKDSTIVEAYIMKGEIGLENQEYTGAIKAFEKAAGMSKEYQRPFYRLGLLYAGIGEYEGAVKHLTTFLEFDDHDPAEKMQAQAILGPMIWANEAKKNPRPFEPENLGPGINSKLGEYHPSIGIDGKTLYFTRDDRSVGDKMDEQFYVSKMDKEWSTATLLKGSINTPRNEGAQSITADGRKLYFTACSRNDGFGSCDIYESVKVEGVWGAAKNLGSVINTKVWDGQPSISPDGKRLYFSSKRNGGRGGKDIWFSDLVDEKWTRPRPTNFNTPGDEQSPFIHADNRTLFFASDGYVGMGQSDLYSVKRNAEDVFEKPENLGYPINTNAREYGMIVSADGRTAYFASTRSEGYGGLDLYKFELYEEARPDQVTFVRGVIVDAVTKERVSGAYSLVDLETNEVVSSDVASEGVFVVTLPVGKEYSLTVEADDYLFFSENYTLNDMDYSDGFVLTAELKKLEVGASITLKNVFFETNKYDLKPVSKVELNKLIELLSDNPTLKIKIVGHTDNVGNANDNLLLSDNRAKAVVDFLVNGGVAAERLSSEGKGATQPIESNDSATGRAANRRTEFVIVQ